MTAATPAGCLRMAEAIPETAENFPMVRELINSLKDLVKISNQQQGETK